MGSGHSTPAVSSWVPVDAGLAIAEVVPHRGLSNEAGQNHCFLNVIIQALWHLSGFRKALLAAEPHRHSATDHPCITCALRSLYAFYQYAEDAVIPPDGLRAALAELYAAQKRFKMGAMEDASETLMAICRAIHQESIEMARRAEAEAAAASGMTVAVASGDSTSSSSTSGTHTSVAADHVMTGASGGAGATMEVDASADTGVPPSPMSGDDASSPPVAASSSSPSSNPAADASGSTGDGTSATSSGSTAPAEVDWMDITCSPPCPAHTAFVFDTFSQVKCTGCGATGDPAPSRDLSHLVYVGRVKEAARILEEQRAHEERVEAERRRYAYIYGTLARPGVGSAGVGPSHAVSPLALAGLNATKLGFDIHSKPTLSILMSLAAAMDGTGTIPPGTAAAIGGTYPHPLLYTDPVTHEQCRSSKYTTERNLLQPFPPVFTVSLAWPSAEETKDTIAVTMGLLEQLLDLRHIFNIEEQAHASASASGDSSGVRSPSSSASAAFAHPSTTYRLRGIVCYYGLHYVCFMASEGRKAWLFFDDDKVPCVGDWTSVVSKCVNSKYQPVLLLYESLAGNVTATSTGTGSGAAGASSGSPVSVSSRPSPTGNSASSSLSSVAAVVGSPEPTGVAAMPGSASFADQSPMSQTGSTGSASASYLMSPPGPSGLSSGFPGYTSATASAAVPGPRPVPSSLASSSASTTAVAASGIPAPVGSGFRYASPMHHSQQPSTHSGVARPATGMPHDRQPSRGAATGTDSGAHFRTTYMDTYGASASVRPPTASTAVAEPGPRPQAASATTTTTRDYRDHDAMHASHSWSASEPQRYSATTHVGSSHPTVGSSSLSNTAGLSTGRVAAGAVEATTPTRLSPRDPSTLAYSGSSAYSASGGAASTSGGAPYARSVAGPHHDAHGRLPQATVAATSPHSSMYGTSRYTTGTGNATTATATGAGHPASPSLLTFPYSTGSGVGAGLYTSELASVLRTAASDTPVPASASVSAVASHTVAPLNPSYRPLASSSAYGPSATSPLGSRYSLSPPEPRRAISAISVYLPIDTMRRILATAAPTAASTGGAGTSAGTHPVSLLSTLGIETADVPADDSFISQPKLFVIDVQRAGSTYRESHKAPWDPKSEPLASLQPGDVIMRVGDSSVTCAAEANTALRQVIEGACLAKAGSYAVGSVGASSAARIHVIIVFGRAPM